MKITFLIRWYILLSHVALPMRATELMKTKKIHCMFFFEKPSKFKSTPWVWGVLMWKRTYCSYFQCDSNYISLKKIDFIRYSDSIVDCIQYTYSMAAFYAECIRFGYAHKNLVNDKKKDNSSNDMMSETQLYDAVGSDA